MTHVPRPTSHVPRSALGVILSQFPRYDEAFILRELTALEQGPQDVVIFSLRPCRDRIVHDEAKPLLTNTVYAPFFWSVRIWASHAYFWRRAPGAYWGTLWWVISRHWQHPAILLKTLAFFPKTVHFARVARERGLGSVHAFWATYPASCAVIIERLTGIPYSLSGHAHDLYTTNPTLVEKIHGARFVVTCTEENQRYLEQLMDLYPRAHVPTCPRGNGATDARKHGHTEARRHVVVNYHGADLKRFAPAPKPAHAACHLLSVGSLLPCKGYETLIEGCRLLRQRGIPFFCTIAGGGPLERSLRRLIERYGLQTQVEITGYVSQETVAKLYQVADLFMLPLVSKIHWGIPNVLIEALATKTPVITCQLPSMGELVRHGQSGWVIPEGDAGALAQSVEYLWANAVLRTQLVEGGYREVVEKFSLEETGRTLRAIFMNGGNGAEVKGRLGAQVPQVVSLLGLGEHRQNGV